MTTLNNNLLIAEGKDKSSKITIQMLTMDAGQLKNYTQMTTARAYATAAGHQGILIITGTISIIHYPLLKCLILKINNGALIMTYHNHTPPYDQ